MSELADGVLEGGAAGKVGGGFLFAEELGFGGGAVGLVELAVGAGQVEVGLALGGVEAQGGLEVVRGFGGVALVEVEAAEA